MSHILSEETAVMTDLLKLLLLVQNIPDALEKFKVIVLVLFATVLIVLKG